MRWSVALLVPVIALAGCLEEYPGPDSTPSLPPDACTGLCPQIWNGTDAFEPDIAVHEQEVVVVHSPFVNELRTLEVMRKSNNWLPEHPVPDVGAAFEGCTWIADPAVAFTPDGDPVITAIAVDNTGDNRVLFFLDSDGNPQPLVHGLDKCVGRNIPDFSRSATTPDGVLLTWRHLNAGDSTDLAGIAWSITTDGENWSPPQKLRVVGDPTCARGSSGPTAVVVDGAMYVGSQYWASTGAILSCLVISDDWATGTAINLGLTAAAWPTPAAVGNDLWVLGATQAGSMEIPTVWKQSNNWLPEQLDALASEGATTPSLAAHGDSALVTSFQQTDGRWQYLATAWNGAWQPSVPMTATTIEGHNMGTSGMGHYMGLADSTNGYWAAWVEGVKGQRVVLAAEIPLETVI